MGVGDGVGMRAIVSAKLCWARLFNDWLRRPAAYLSPMGWHDKEGLDVVGSQKGVPLVAVTWLYFIVPIQACEGRLCDVNLPTREEHKGECELTSVAAQGPGRCTHWSHNRGHSVQGKITESYALMFWCTGNLGRENRKSQASQVMGNTPKKAE